MSDDATRKLPPGIRGGFHRDEHALAREAFYARRGLTVLHKERPPAVGQLALIEIHQERDGGWCILQGQVARVRPDGRLELEATMSSSGPPVLDRRWRVVLAYDARFYDDGPWLVEVLAALEARQ